MGKTLKQPLKSSNNLGRIFLSFCRDDSHLAGLFYKLLCNLTGDEKKVFKADEPQKSGIKAGEDWRNKILDELIQTPVLVGVITPKSLTNKWTWIEGGIAWARSQTKLVFFVAPNIPVSDLSPFDHIQCSFMSKTSLTPMREALIQAVQFAGHAPKWTPYTSQLLNRIIVAANMPIPMPPASESVKVSLSRKMRDQNTIMKLLQHLPTSVFDNFIDELESGRILNDIFFYNEGFNSVVTAGFFQLHDKKLLNIVTELLDAWNASLDFGELCTQISERFYRFMTVKELGNNYDRWAKEHKKFVTAISAVKVAYHNFLFYIKETYPDINLEEATNEAIKLKNKYYSDNSAK